MATLTITPPTIKKKKVQVPTLASIPPYTVFRFVDGIPGTFVKVWCADDEKDYYSDEPMVYRFICLASFNSWTGSAASSLNDQEVRILPAGTVLTVTL